MIGFKLPFSRHLPTSATAIAQTKEQVAERRRELRRRSDKAHWRMLYAFVLLVIFAISYQAWLIQNSNREISISRWEIRRLKTELSELNTSVAATDGESRAVLDHLKLQVGDLFTTSWLKEKSRSVLEVVALWDKGNVTMRSSAGYIGEGYFLTVQHGVYSGTPSTGLVPSQERFIFYDGKNIPAKIHKRGKRYEIGNFLTIDDWVVLKVDQDIDVPALTVPKIARMAPGKAIARFGNDLGWGVVFDTGYLGHRINSGLYSSLISSHSGNSGGSVLNVDGELIGITIGRSTEGDNFVYIQKLIPEMFVDIPHLKDRLAQ